MYSTSSLGQSLLTLLLATSVGCAVSPSSTPGVSAVAEPASGQARRANAETGRLAHWTFNDAGWHGERGQAPRRAENLQRVEGVEGSAVEFTNVQAVLTYRAIEADGSPNIGLQAGTVRFWYRPNWRSNAQYYDAGLGPRQRVRLLDLGTCALDINPNGDTLVFQSADGQGAVRTNVQTRFYWPLTNWNEIILRYSPTESSLILNGNPPARGPGIEALSPSSAQDQGFALGGSTDGALRALGRIDEVETYGFPLGIAAIRDVGNTLTAQAVGSPPGIKLVGKLKAYAHSTIRRRPWLGPEWETLATNILSWTYIDDRDIAVGERYEYEVGGQYLLAGLRAAPVESRGKVILLVDETLAPSLESELETLKTDLVGDGWTVIRKDVPRHDDTDWSRNGRHVAMIKSFITAICRADRGELPAKAVFVLGHVAIPYSGAGAEDGHPDHAGAWPADLFYGDVDGQWTDERAHRERPANLRLQNLAGDGKFDQGMVPTNETGVAAIELAVGRVDLSRLPAFSSQSEVQLVRQYLDKNHRFRHGQLSFGARTIVGSYFDNALDRAMHCQAWRNGSRLFGFDPSTVIEGDLFVRRLSCLWGIQGGYANSSSINTVSGVNRKLGTFNHSVRDLAQPGGDPRVGLYALAGSYFGDWDTPDNLLRATLALPRSGLAAMWAHQIDWHFETAALGEPLGVGLLQTVRQNPLGPSRTIALLGDPTLRLTVTPPPANLSLRRDGDRVVLRWEAAPQSDVRYRVYRAASIDAPFTPLTPGGITGNSFTTRNATEKLYQVRAASLVVTASGSFTNLSQGVFITAR